MSATCHFDCSVLVRRVYQIIEKSASRGEPARVPDLEHTASPPWPLASAAGVFRGVALAVGVVVAVAVSALSATSAHAACTLPNTFANGQTADATQVMGNFNSVVNCANSAVSATGTPITGALAAFSGANTIASGNLSGDCVTSGTTATTCTKTNGVSLGYFATGTDSSNLTGTISVSRFNGGSGASTTTFLRGDGAWVAPSGTGGARPPITRLGTTGTSVATSTDTTVTWTSAPVDEVGAWSSGAPTVLTVPPGFTQARATAQGCWTSNGSGYRRWYVYYNGVAIAGQHEAVNVGTDQPQLGTTYYFSVVPGGSIILGVRQNSGTTLTFGQNGNCVPFMQVEWYP
jgi:hypothetical protein